MSQFTFVNPGAAQGNTIGSTGGTQTPPGAPPVPAGVTITATQQQTVVINGPSSLDRDAAQRIFNQQLASGSLIGLRAGDVITAATQAANGLTTAESQLLQQISQSPSQAQQSSAAKTITTVLATVSVTNSITVADYARQPATAQSIGGLSAVQITSVLAQLHKLVNQPAEVLTQQGLGRYALSVPQLAAANYVKSSALALWETGQGSASTVGVLKSPNVWTGLDGIKTAQDLLLAESTQQQIQLTLMSAALTYLQDFGISIENLPPRSQAGALLSVAKAPELAVAWLTGQPVPAEASTLFSQYVRDGAYAVDFADSKVNNAMVNEADPVGVTNTTDRARLDAATNRIVGNAKVPPLIYGSEPVNPVLVDQFDSLQASFVTTQDLTNAVASQTTTTQNALTRQTKLESYKTTLTTLKSQVSVLRQQASTSVPISPNLIAQLDLLLKQIDNLIAKINNSVQFVEQAKIQLQRR
jgi:hypothetical protein